MLAPLNRYDFQPHQFRLTHDVGLENFDTLGDDDVTPTMSSLMGGANDAFILDLANENELKLRSPSASSLLHLHETSNIYESSSIDMKINLKNMAKSKQLCRDGDYIHGREEVNDSRPRSTVSIGWRDPANQHIASETLLIDRDLRIEDFARIGTDCVKVNLDKIRNESKLFSGRNLDLLREAKKNRKSYMKQEELRARGRQLESDDRASKRHTARRLPEIPAKLPNERILVDQRMKSSSLPRAPMSLANELKAVIKIERHLTSLAEELQAAIQSQSVDGADELSQRWFPLGLSYYGIQNKALSCNCEDLGTPDHVDPVNKYSFEDWAQAAFYVGDTKADGDLVHSMGVASRDMCSVGEINKNKNSSDTIKNINTNQDQILPSDKESPVCIGDADEINLIPIDNKDSHAEDKQTNNNIDTYKSNYLDTGSCSKHSKDSREISTDNYRIVGLEDSDAEEGDYKYEKRMDYDTLQQTYNNEEKNRDESEERHSGCRKSCCISDSEAEDDGLTRMKENKELAPNSNTVVNPPNNTKYAPPSATHRSRPRCLPDLVSFSNWLSDEQTSTAALGRRDSATALGRREDESVLRKEMKNCANLSSRGVVPCVEDEYDNEDEEEQDGEDSNIPPRRCSRERSAVGRVDISEVSQGKKFLIGRPDSSRVRSPVRKSFFTLSGRVSPDLYLDETDATHRGCHKFVPRHAEELAIEIGDPIYVDDEADDLWCEGVNLRTKQRGVFPTVYATDLSILNQGDGRRSKFFVKFLGSIEVNHHRGNDVLCQAVNKLVSERQKTMDTSPPKLCTLEIDEFGIKMEDRSKKKPPFSHFAKSASVTEKLSRMLTQDKESATSNDHFFSTKNICFCGSHPKNDRYLGFITKHPIDMRFACHVFVREKSTKDIAEAIGVSLRNFYEEYLACVHPTEDIYIE